MIAPADAVRTNRDKLVRTRLTAQVQPASANRVITPDGILTTLPGQGGVVAGLELGDRAGPWMGDHVEPGVSLGHPDPAANHAVRLLSCVGNPVTMLDGPAAGAKGMVYGKHGAVLAMFAPEQVGRIAPGERAAIDAEGVGLAVDEESDMACHSCSPLLFERLVGARDSDGRIPIEVVAILPSIAAAAGIGMPSQMFNMDLHVYSEPVAELARNLRFGDIVAVLDQDHRFGRQHRPGWLAVGVISHGNAVGGGHGFGLMTLLTAPADRLAITRSDSSNVGRLLNLPWRIP